jgi:MFS family permease
MDRQVYAYEYLAPAVRAARRATYAMFFADGLGFGIWAGHIPALKQKFQLSDSLLSTLLLAVAAGSIVSMPLAGQAVRHFGSRRCIVVSIACYGLCLLAIAVAPNLILFVVAALLFGASKGGVDVSINAQAVVVERCYGRAIMSSFQALWSVGGLAGGFLTSAALALGSTPLANLTGVGSLLLLLDRLCYFHLMRDATPGEPAGADPLSPAWQSIALGSEAHFYCLIQRRCSAGLGSGLYAASGFGSRLDCRDCLCRILQRNGSGTVRRRPGVGFNWRTQSDAPKRWVNYCWPGSGSSAANASLRHCGLCGGRPREFQSGTYPL